MGAIRLTAERIGDGCMVHINEVENGIECNCICPTCRQTLIARHGEVNQPHFAHTNSLNCLSAGELWLHKASKKFISENNHIKLPDGRIFYYQDIAIEKKYKGIRPDVLLRNGEELLAVEIIVTNSVKPEKRERLHKYNLRCLEIDISDVRRDITEAELENIILDEIDGKFIYETMEATPSASGANNFVAGLMSLVLFVLGLIFLRRYLKSI